MVVSETRFILPLLNLGREAHEIVISAGVRLAGELII